MVSYKRLKTIEIFISRDVVAAIYERRSFTKGPTIIFEWENFGVLDEWLSWQLWDVVTQEDLTLCCITGKTTYFF